jgi:hypothetical protein
MGERGGKRRGKGKEQKRGKGNGLNNIKKIKR